MKKLKLIAELSVVLFCLHFCGLCFSLFFFQSRLDHGGIERLKSGLEKCKCSLGISDYEIKLIHFSWYQ